jgi:hypothetical protein
MDRSRAEFWSSNKQQQLRSQNLKEGYETQAREGNATLRLGCWAARQESRWSPRLRSGSWILDGSMSTWKDSGAQTPPSHLPGWPARFQHSAEGAQQGAFPQVPVFPLAVRGGCRRLVRKALHPPTAGVAGVSRPNHGRDRDRGADAFSPPLQQWPGAMGCVSGSRAATGSSADWGGGRGRKGNSLHHSPGGPCVSKSRSVSLPQTQHQQS